MFAHNECTDMWNLYREVTQAVLPHARLVVDKFYITRMANESMEVVLKGLKSSLTAPQRRTLYPFEFWYIFKKVVGLRGHGLPLLQCYSAQDQVWATCSIQLAYHIFRIKHNVADRKIKHKVAFLPLYALWHKFVCRHASHIDSSSSTDRRVASRQYLNKSSRFLPDGKLS